jgi:hypothetical protein
VCSFGGRQNARRRRDVSELAGPRRRIGEHRQQACQWAIEKDGPLTQRLGVTLRAFAHPRKVFTRAQEHRVGLGMQARGDCRVQCERSPLFAGHGRVKRDVGLLRLPS